MTNKEPEKSERSFGSASSGGDEQSRIGALGGNPTLQITPVKLDGNNYLSQSRACLLSIDATGLYNYVTRTLKEPASTDPTLEQWRSSNSLVMSWLLNSMQPHISRGFLFLKTAYEIWTVVAQKLIMMLRSTISTSVLKEKEQVYDFLVGLNYEYDQSRGQVLGHDPFPTLRQKDFKSPHPRVENKGGNSEKDPMKCDYCGKRWHAQDNWKLHARLNTGRVDGKTGFGRPHAHLIEASDTPHASTEHVDHLTSEELQGNKIRKGPSQLKKRCSFSGLLLFAVRGEKVTISESTEALDKSSYPDHRDHERLDRANLMTYVWAR
ncbi:hypothetical protein F0562_012185 [Nyssa sinensis]|uniref:C2H2-type domain-containing protein n=1 Tax=Nyssa sinensis TaxID=561372 RepID=A0A5J4ZUH3_9ASTE|nr:hypothetical protein F0562_012185 [Nyssa sinensis]